MNNRPTKDEYGAYYEQYISLVPTGNIQDILREQLRNTSDFLASLTMDQGNYRYAPDKWSLKEVIGHINDNERVMAYRLLRFARGDKTELTGYDQDTFMAGVSFDTQSMAELIEDYAAIRQSTLTLLRGLSEQAWSRIGTANQNKMSVNVLAYIIAGHEIHHLKIIRERYISN
ncbi:DinB family protein [Cohnella luojiensis]|uniref:DinB family protein n=1 Tax=Cohnella luojiensis TaxID=652876 RepID=A0A4Y8LP83_9BACL|nr:DinB family protein [Cohnella luojiensis]TFE22733.1 DinB family protein [Cohnella luojiensis]